MNQQLLKNLIRLFQIQHGYIFRYIYKYQLGSTCDRAYISKDSVDTGLIPLGYC